MSLLDWPPRRLVGLPIGVGSCVGVAWLLGASLTISGNNELNDIAFALVGIVVMLGVAGFFVRQFVTTCPRRVAVRLREASVRVSSPTLFVAREDLLPPAFVAENRDNDGDVVAPIFGEMKPAHRRWLEDVAWLMLRPREVRHGMVVLLDQPGTIWRRGVSVVTQVVFLAAAAFVGVGLVTLMGLDDFGVAEPMAMAAAWAAATVVAVPLAVWLALVFWRQRAGGTVDVTASRVVVRRAGQKPVRLRRALLMRPEVAGRWLLLQEHVGIGRHTARLWLPLGRRRQREVVDDLRRALGFVPTGRAFEVLPVARVHEPDRVDEVR
jgi:hypothetical protein